MRQAGRRGRDGITCIGKPDVIMHHIQMDEFGSPNTSRAYYSVSKLASRVHFFCYYSTLVSKTCFKNAATVLYDTNYKSEGVSPGLLWTARFTTFGTIAKFREVMVM